jgi:sulfur transfer complex TusBCD TusB component (DsrH family)
MALYIFDAPYYKNGIPYALNDNEAKILLLNDALYIDASSIEGREVYVLTSEVAKRGLSTIIPESFKRIDYGEAVDIIMANRVINFA